MAFLDEAGLRYFFGKLKEVFGTVKTVNGNKPDSSGNVSITIPNPVIASQAEAEAGTDNTKHMTPLRVKQAIEFLSPKPEIASVEEAIAGENDTKMMTPLKTKRAIEELAAITLKVW